MMGKLLRLALLPVLVPLLIASAQEAAAFALGHLRVDLMLPFLLGMFLYGMVYLFIPADQSRFLEILEHELDHAVVGMLTFRRISRLVVDPAKNDSEVQSLGMAPTAFISALAPYYFPLLTIPCLLARPFVAPAVHQIVDALIGFTLAFHYVGLLKEFGLHQTDISRLGLLFSICVAGSLNILILVVVWSVMLGSLSYVLDYVASVYLATLQMCQSALQYAMALVAN